MGGSRSPFPGRFPRFGGPPGGFGGTPGFLRFTRPQLAEQISWLFPLAFFGAWAGFLQYGLRISGGPQQAALVTWVGWLATHVVVFSFARGIFHEYYSIIIGPAIAAIVGIGVPALWQQFQTHTWRRRSCRRLSSRRERGRLTSSASMRRSATSCFRFRSVRFAWRQPCCSSANSG